MNQMQQMLMQAQKMQRELVKAREALAAKDFPVSKAGMVEIVLKGDKTIKKIAIDKEALDPENKDMLEESIALAINEGLKKIDEESEAIDEEITGRKGALPF